MRRLSASQLAVHLETERPLLLDVREPWEFEICHLGDSINIPLGQLPHHVNELEDAGEIVVICHHGIRSQYAIRYLQQHSSEELINLDGGVDAWAREVDPDMPLY